MKSWSLIFAAALVAAWTPSTPADTTEARCDICPNGEVYEVPLAAIEGG